MTNSDVSRRDNALQLAISYTLRRRRTEWQVRTKLEGLGFAPEDIGFVMERLKEDLLIGDSAYADDFISSRLATKPVSRRMLENKLRQNGIPADMVHDAIASVSDDIEMENALVIARRAMPSLAKNEPDDVGTVIYKTVRRLMSRGYSYEHAKRAAETVANEMELSITEEDRY